jgi:DNA-binding helix-hairpin-helix protein with protein kinase domain
MIDIESSPIFNGTGGEGAVYESRSKPGQLFKKYKPGKMTPAVEEKLKYMIANPIKVGDENSKFAWPTEIGYENGQAVGFYMPRLACDEKIYFAYDYTNDESEVRNYKNRVIVARNLCTMIHWANINNFVIGDFNDKNIGLDKITGYVSMFDCDSFHLLGGLHRCGACMPGYAAPELLKAMRAEGSANYLGASLPTFTEETDLFALAIHVFRLLMNGAHPFNGIDVTLDSSSAIAGAGDQPVHDGLYCFALGKKPKNRTIPPLLILPDIFAEYFDKAFIHYEGGRPTWRQWLNALDNYRAHLVQCGNNLMHWHHKDLSCCPWCEADERESRKNRGLFKPKFKVRRTASEGFRRELYLDPVDLSLAGSYASR